MSRRRLLRLIFWAATVFTFAMAVLPHPPELPGSPSDKVQHIAAFTTLGLLGSLGYREKSGFQLVLCLSIFGAGIEAFQAIPALHRDSSVFDWIADTISCGLAVALMRRLRTR